MTESDSQFMRICRIVPETIPWTPSANDMLEPASQPALGSQPALEMALRALAANDELRRALVDMQAAAARWCLEARREHKRFRLAFGMCFVFAALAVVGWALWLGGQVL